MCATTSLNTFTLLTHLQGPQRRGNLHQQ
jgi:hypothetical protein